MTRPRKTKLNYKQITFFVLACILAVYFAFSSDESSKAPVTPDENGIYVHFIDVGQGDAALVQTVSGNLLIDAGTPDSAEALTEYIDDLGIHTLDYAVFTHPHADHIGGAVQILEKYSLRNVILPNAVSTSYTLEKMMDAIEKENCEVIEGKAGVFFDMGEVQVELLGPVSDHSQDADDLNNTSVVVKVTYGEVSFLFTGDAETESEYEMLDRDAEKLNVNILKVGHHGSSTSSCASFLKAASPEVAIVSAGLYNEYGHPHAEVISRLHAIGASLYRTDKHGSVVVYTDGQTYSIQTEK